MPTINGKEVVFKETLAAKDWWPLLPKLIGLKQSNWLEVLSFDTVCQIIAGCVATWEFDGSPDDPEAVGELDAFDELLPLLRDVSSFLNERLSLGEPEERST